LIVQFDRKLIENSLKAGPVVCFLFAKNNFAIQCDLKASNVGEKHVFFGQLIVVLVFLLLNG
jgi:hypothetical protein